MGEGNSNVLVKNEKQANKAVAKVMRITFVMFTLVYFMNVAGIFIVDMKIMTIAYGMAAVLLWLPTLLVNVLKLEQPFVKYVLTIIAVSFVTISAVTLTYHVVLLYIYAIAIASLYFSKRLNILVTVLSVVGVSVGQWVSFALNTLPDKNLTSTYKLVVFGIVPRALILVALAAIFTMLCKRTAEMLSSLLGAEEQEKLMEDMKRMQEKTGQTSDYLLTMVKDLSTISGSSAKANARIVEETSGVLQSFSDNTAEIEGMNEKTKEINNRLIELNDMNNQISSLAEHVNEETKDNQSKMDFAMKSMEQINASTDECRAVISQLGEESKEILGIIQLITGISGQTNILALNASIEAARAGENGKGFAVVADEIRNLSEQSRNSAEEILAIVSELIRNSNTSVETMNHVSGSVQEQNAKLGNTKEMFVSLNTEISSVSSGVERIRHSMEELERVKDTVMASVEQLAAIAEENAASTEETSAAMTELRSIVKQCHDETQELVKISADLNAHTKHFTL